MSSSFHCKSLEPSLNLFMHVADIQFKRSDWSTEDIDWIISGCDIHLMKIVMFGKTEMNDTQLHVTRSQIGQDIFIHSTNAMLHNCSLLGNNLLQKEPHVKVLNSRIEVVSSHFENVNGRSFLWVTSGNVYIRDVMFLNSVPIDSLIRLMHGSSMTMDNCIFTQIGGECVLLDKNSTATIRNSTFKNNRDFHNTTQENQGYLLIFVSKSLLQVTHCVFLKNVCPSAAPIYLEDGSFGLVEHSEFIDNNAGLKMTVASISSSIKLFGCRFVHNKGRAVASVNSSFLSVSNCLFKNNSANFGGCIYVRSEAGHTDNRTEIGESHTIVPDKATKCSTRPHIFICNCTFVGNTATGGGAIYAVGMSLSLENSHFTNNSAVQHKDILTGVGGAIFYSSNNKNDSLEISESSFMDNHASIGGGAILCADSLTKIQGSVFITNSAGVDGGAIGLKSLSANSTLNQVEHIFNCSFVGNTANQGGAVWAGNVSLLLQNNIFANNSARTINTSGGFGGAIWHLSLNRNHSIQILNSSFHHNLALYAGGAVASGSEGDVQSCVFVGNTARTIGGALSFISSTSVTITSCHFLSNSADVGGAVYSSTSLFQIIRKSNFIQNTATTDGGAIQVAQNTGSLTQFSCCNFHNNTAGLV